MRSILSAFVFLLGAACVGFAPEAASQSAEASSDKDKKDNKDKGKPNKLAKESSPYLLQHAHNPVEWYPWGQEAFEKAKKEKKLIFLSIGYSACHWCHVMERESFSNADIAKVLNAHFVCIKVDREERPDVDDIYMTALQVQGEQGGWPLSMFLTPEGKPIFGATYFPPEDKKVGDDTIPGFKSVLAKVLEFDKDRADLERQAERIAKKTVELLDANSRAIALVPLKRELVADALDYFDIDPEHGGTGSKARGYRGTKFPRPPVWGFLLAQSQKKGNEKLAKSVHLTLAKMLEGGIYDHLGGGFHRYSTERTWTVPHFEKMLYDNAQLVELYSDAFAADPRPEYKRVVAETLGFVKREMTSPDKGFYSALDADSNEKEGEFYVWTVAEIGKVLGNDADAVLVKKVYGVTAPNFEERFHILRLPKSLAEIAKDLKLSEEELLAKLEPLKKKLFDARAKRERPFLDTKIIAAWNG
ncbi:MAG: thioredoxin domain-containing protein, partial [Gemmataceae bacterium]|nr:thioredoxin domain-containing protein [Gemmataceae bacterium]